MIAQKQSVDKNLLKRTWGKFLNEKPWSAFCTFTTYYKLSLNNARRKMDEMNRKLHHMTDKSISIFWVAEPFAYKNEYHIHALIYIDLPFELVQSMVKQAWKSVSYVSGYKKQNIMTIEAYDPLRGANFYVAKQLGQENIDFDIIIA